ncbi:MAG: 3-hydroxyisobutyrate dehydrogenase-like beta-hydroxyacid dehydrogenase [Gammaproteobacteria bacterium]|jgi:3-hydroxyisobutyrate dehydrogenase-like beta-hydroxyacid dehydrogenase
MNIGFIGIGRMAVGMVRNLLAAGHSVQVYNRTRARAEELASHGAEVVDSIAAACDNELVISMLADDRAIEDVVFGDVDFINALPSDGVHVSMATISEKMGRRLRDSHSTAGRAYVSAPVFGRPDAAAAAKLFIVAAGIPSAIARCQPAFDVMGQRTFVLGEDAVAANVVKITGNFMLASVIETLGEAFALSRKYGIDSEDLLELLTSTLFTAPVYKGYGALIAKEQYEPAGFKLNLGLKDISLALEAADAKSVSMPLASAVRDQFLVGIERGYQDLDWAALGKVCADDAGL